MNVNEINVLLIEDSLPDAEFIQRLIERTENVQFSFDHVLRLAEGLARIEQKRFDVILLNLALPDSHGITALDDVQAKAPEIPIIVLIVSSQEDLAAEAMSIGAHDYVIKDKIRGDILHRAITSAIERKQWRAS